MGVMALMLGGCSHPAPPVAAAPAPVPQATQTVIQQVQAPQPVAQAPDPQQQEEPLPQPPPATVIIQQVVPVGQPAFVFGIDSGYYDRYHHYYFYPRTAGVRLYAPSYHGRLRLGVGLRVGGPRYAAPRPAYAAPRLAPAASYAAPRSTASRRYR